MPQLTPPIYYVYYNQILSFFKAVPCKFIVPSTIVAFSTKCKSHLPTFCLIYSKDLKDVMAWPVPCFLLLLIIDLLPGEALLIHLIDRKRHIFAIFYNISQDHTIGLILEWKPAILMFWLDLAECGVAIVIHKVFNAHKKSPIIFNNEPNLLFELFSPSFIIVWPVSLPFSMPSKINVYRINL